MSNNEEIIELDENNEGAYFKESKVRKKYYNNYNNLNDPFPFEREHDYPFYKYSAQFGGQE